MVDLDARRDAARLVRLALDGRPAAMRQLTWRLMPVIRARVRAYFARRGGASVGAHDLDDLMQDVWLALIADGARLLRAYDPERGRTLEGYVGLIARRELWKRFQQTIAQKRGAGQADVALDEGQAASLANSPGDQVEQRQTLRRLVEHLMGALPGRGQAVLQALYNEGLDVSEAAQMLGVNTQVVYNWQHKIRQLSRSWMAAQGG